ncbi:polysaccharide biosynthesis protein GumE [Methylobacterium sp. JK268]
MSATSASLLRAPRGAAAALAGSRPATVLLAHVPFWILGAAMLFNAALAVVNGSVTGLSPGIVIGCEILVMGAALLVAAAHYRPSMALSVALIAWLFLFMAVRAIAVDPATSVKYFRDILIAPVFMMLGLCASTRLFDRYLAGIHAVVVVVGMLEAFNVEAYSALFRVKDYFIATRGLTEADFWNTESDLFVSATRPDARFLSIADQFMDAHRVSSVFLEPVSLGGYCVIIAAYVFSRWEKLSVAARVLLLSSNFFLMVACDGRLALVAFVMILIATRLWHLLPRATPVLYLPGALLCAFLFVGLTGQAGGSDDFSGRIAWTVDLLRAYDVPEFLGLSEKLISKAVDSGVGYVITTQSLAGLAAFWLYCAFSTRYRTREQIRYAHALCLYVTFNALVSYGFLSIKTASLLWLIKGMLESEGDAALRADGA